MKFVLVGVRAKIVITVRGKAIFYIRVNQVLEIFGLNYFAVMFYCTFTPYSRLLIEREIVCGEIKINVKLFRELGPKTESFVSAINQIANQILVLLLCFGQQMALCLRYVANRK